MAGQWDYAKEESIVTGLTIDILNDIIKKMSAVPREPVLASWSLLESDKVTCFKCEGRSYYGAGPGFWAQFETSKQVSPFGAVPVYDLDDELNRARKVEFTRALAAVLAQTQTAPP
jgi:hypothetical protein